MVTAKERFLKNKAVNLYDRLTTWHTRFAWLPKIIYSSDSRKFVWLRKYHVIYCCQVVKNVGMQRLSKGDWVYFRVADTRICEGDLVTDKLKGHEDVQTNHHRGFTKDEVAEHISNYGCKIIH